MDKPRDYATELREILNRRANGRTIWQPRILCWYSDRRYRMEEFPGRFRGVDSERELFKRLGISNRLYEFTYCINYKSDDPGIRYEKRKIDDLTDEHFIHTKKGSVNAIYRRNLSNGAEREMKWWVETPNDLEVFMYIEENRQYAFDRGVYDQKMETWGPMGLPGVHIPRVNIQKMFIELCGVENTIYLLNDYPDTVEAFFESVNRSNMRFVEMLCDTPYEWVNFGDNIHSKIVSPKLFEKYVLPHYLERNEKLHAAGKFTCAHFDGDVKELFPYFRECGLDGIEAITPLPQGDVTLKEAKDALGDMFLIDGIAAILFEENYPLKMLRRQAEECMHLFEGQLVMGISDEISSHGTMDRIEYVAELVEDFNAKR